MPLTYGDVFLQNEQEQSTYNFEVADTEMLFRHFADAEKECARLIEHKLPLPAYEQCIKASHCFNLLDARGVISVTERQSYILRVRDARQGVLRGVARDAKEAALDGRTAPRAPERRDPRRMQARAADLKRLVGEGLKAAGIAFTDARRF